MIEYNDKKGGKIKVVNVTEARANFAEVLGDNRASYVVTKNSKPVRAIIDYEDFVLLRKSQQAQGFSENLEPDDFQEMGLPRPDRRQKSKSRVRGLLGTHEELLRQKPAFEESTESPPLEIKVQEETFVQKKDYFHTPDDDYLISPDEIEMPEAKPVEAAKVQSPEPPVPLPDPAVQKSPEEQEYFDKYKKLYGNLESKDASPTDLDRQVEERVEQLLRPKLSQAVTQAQTGVAQQFKAEPKPAATQAFKESTGVPIKSVTPKNNMPSLKDLLRELDNEKLSIIDDDQELALDDEIDDLIHRITQD